MSSFFRSVLRTQQPSRIIFSFFFCSFIEIVIFLPCSLMSIHSKILRSFALFSIAFLAELSFAFLCVFKYSFLSSQSSPRRLNLLCRESSISFARWGFLRNIYSPKLELGLLPQLKRHLRIRPTSALVFNSSRGRIRCKSAVFSVGKSPSTNLDEYILIGIENCTFALAKEASSHPPRPGSSYQQ